MLVIRAPLHKSLTRTFCPQGSRDTYTFRALLDRHAALDLAAALQSTYASSATNMSFFEHVLHKRHENVAPYLRRTLTNPPKTLMAQPAAAR